MVEITINKNKNPSKDWLRFVKTSLAKSNIKKLTSQDESGFKFPIPGFIKRKFAEYSEAKQKRKSEKELIKKGGRQTYLFGWPKRNVNSPCQMLQSSTWRQG